MITLFKECYGLYDDFANNFIDEDGDSCALYMRFKCVVKAEGSFEQRFKNAVYVGSRSGTAADRMCIERKNDNKGRQVILLNLSGLILYFRWMKTVKFCAQTSPIGKSFVVNFLLCCFG
jgi:hypothetical protein